MAIADLAAHRRRLQRALLGVLRGESLGLSLSNLEACLDELEEAAEEPAARELWSASICLVRGLRLDADPPDQASLRLMGQLDRALRTQLLEGEGALAEASFDELAEAFRRHPRSRNDEFEDTGSDQSDDLAGLTATMNVLSRHPVWRGSQRLSSGVKQESPGPTEDSQPERIQTSAHQEDADNTDAVLELEEDYDPSDRVPLANARSRLTWVVRQAGRDLGRPVELNWSGDVLLPRARLRRLMPHLECVVKNTVYLGITSPENWHSDEPPALRIAVRGEGGGAVLELRTNGLALDLKRLRRRAEEAGLAPQVSASSDELLSLLLQPGFTTAHRATQVAGYGVGLDAACVAMTAIGGRMRIDLAGDGGLRVTIQIPG